jgi:two-component system, NarL family, response regulator DegU
VNDKIIRVLLADCYARMHAGIRNLLEVSTDIIVVGEAKDGVNALALVSELQLDVLVLDVEMPNINGLEAVRQSRRAG